MDNNEEMKRGQEYASHLRDVTKQMGGSRMLSTEQWAKFAAPMVAFLSVRWDMMTEEDRRNYVDQIMAQLPPALLAHTAGVAVAFAKSQGTI